MTDKRNGSAKMQSCSQCNELPLTAKLLTLHTNFLLINAEYNKVDSFFFFVPILACTDSRNKTFGRGKKGADNKGETKRAQNKKGAEQKGRRKKGRRAKRAQTEQKGRRTKRARDHDVASPLHSRS